MRVKTRTKLVNRSIAAGVAMLGVSAIAGNATYDFDTDPVAQGIELEHNLGLEPWRQTGGNPATGGYLTILEPQGSRYGIARFPDFDQGLVVAGFRFQCDVRAGQSEGDRPADGYSICFAAADDPALVSGTGQSGYVSGVAEMGTRTGVAISFDTWAGNALPDGPDIEGIIVRVNNVTVLKHPLATRHGACTDPTSLQTGNRDASKFPVADYSDPVIMQDVRAPLCWQPLLVELKDGLLTVKWKGVTVLDKASVGAFGAAGRLIFGGRTGGANQCADFDNIQIETYAAACATIVGASADATGYTMQISDSGDSAVDVGSITMKVDGTAVSPIDAVKNGATTTVRYTTAPNWLVSGSAHTLSVTYNAGAGCQNITGERSVTVAPYATITPAMRVSGVGTQRGFLARTWQVESPQGNDNERTERELFGEIGNNVVDLTQFTQTVAGTPNKYVVEPEYLNHNADGAVDQGMFGAGAADPQRQAAEKSLWGFPSNSQNVGNETDYIAAEAIFYATFTSAGIHVWGCNSDDGFRMYAGKNPLDRFQVGSVMLGEFSGGRGTAGTPQTLFTFLVLEPGTYPFRYTWEEGEGGNNLEVYEQLPDGSVVLLNDTTRNPAAIMTYWQGPVADRAYIAKVYPGVGDGVGPAQGALDNKIEITLMDANTAVVDSSIKTWYNGVEVTPTIANNGTTTTVSFAPNPALAFDAGGTVRISYDETGGGMRDQQWSFRARRMAPDDLTSYAGGSIWIEVEDYNYGGGQTMADASVMPYYGGGYAGQEGIINVDWFDDQTEQDGGIDRGYRFIPDASNNLPNPHADLAGNLGGRFGADRPGDTDVTVNYKIGWMGNFWGNYTRTVPAGIYTAYTALSIDNSNVDGMSASLGKVTSDPTTTGQTVESLGTFRGRGNGGWSNNELCPLYGPDNKPAYFKVAAGADTTFRFTSGSGDTDWFVLVPSPSAPPQLKSVAPNSLLFPVPRDAAIVWTFEDFSTTYNTMSTKLKINGAEVPAAHVTTVKNGAITTVTYDPPGLFDIGKNMAFELSFMDSASKPIVQTGNFIAHFMPDSPANMFLIEGEDFNVAGVPQPGVSAMPYLGNAYAGLGGTVGVDYFRNDAEPSGDIYRTGETPNVPFSVDGDLVRARDASGAATWTLTASYRLGWAGSGRWMDYTRDIPAGDYQVWASMSYGETPSTAVRATGELREVTSDPTQPNQTTSNIGSFRGPATGGWGANQLVPMRTPAATSGDAAVVALGGTTTLQFEYASSDFDYMMLVKVGGAPPQPEFTKIVKNTDGTITVEWTGGGTLQASPTISPAAWQDVTGATSPYTFTPTAAMLFGRVRQ